MFDDPQIPPVLYDEYNSFPTSPELRLMAAIVERAILDCAGASQISAADRRTAEFWVFSDNTLSDSELDTLYTLKNIGVYLSSDPDGFVTKVRETVTKLKETNNVDKDNLLQIILHSATLQL
jgi:hypothetical protein